MDYFQQLLSEVTLLSPSMGSIFAGIVACLLLFVSGFASGSEIAFFSLSPADLNDLDETKTDADAQIQQLREESERTLATILITNNLVNVTIIMLFTYFFDHTVDFGGAWWLEFLCITVLLTFLLLLFGEIMPKVYAARYPLRFCRAAVGGIMFCRKLFYPFASIVMGSGRLADKVVQKENHRNHGAQKYGHPAEPGHRVVMHSSAVLWNVHGSYLRGDPDRQGRSRQRDHKCQHEGAKDNCPAYFHWFPLFFRRFFSHRYDLQAGFIQNIDGKVIRISLPDDDALDSRVDNHLGADGAGLMGDVDCAVLNALAQRCRLNNRVLLRVKRPAELVTLSGRNSQFLPQAASLLRTVRHASRCAVIACGNDVSILDDHSAHMPSQTGRALRGQLRHGHEIFIP